MRRVCCGSSISRTVGLLLLSCGALLVWVGCSEGWRGGIHAQMAWSAERGLRVIDVPDGPARRAGLREDDRVVAIAHVPVAGRPIADVVAELRGDVGTHVHLTIERGGQRDGGIEAAEPATEDLEIERAPYTQE